MIYKKRSVLNSPFSGFRDELPTLIDSVKAVKFVSQTGREISFDAYGNALNEYSFFNYVKDEKETVATGQRYIYKQVWSY